MVFFIWILYILEVTKADQQCRRFITKKHIDVDASKCRMERYNFTIPSAFCAQYCREIPGVRYGFIYLPYCDYLLVQFIK